MRDMQSMFFERRARLERVSDISREQLSKANDLVDQWRLNQLMPPESNQPLDSSMGMSFHLSLISSEDFGIDNLPDLFNKKVQPMSQTGASGFVQIPAWTNQWKRSYRSVSYVGGYQSNRSCVEIGADGVISISLTRVDGRFHPIMYSKIIVQGLGLVDWFRRWSSRPDIEYVLQGNFQKLGNPAIPHYNGIFEIWVPVPWKAADFGPYSITSRARFPEVHDVIERELWDLFGSARVDGLTVDWDAE
jgi:hypothetical protein